METFQNIQVFALTNSASFVHNVLVLDILCACFCVRQRCGICRNYLVRVSCLFLSSTGSSCPLFMVSFSGKKARQALVSFFDMFCLLLPRRMDGCWSVDPLYFQTPHQCTSSLYMIHTHVVCWCLACISRCDCCPV